jgi:hypothetical protein
MSDYLELGDSLDREPTDGVGAITTIDMTDEELEQAKTHEQQRPPFGFQT